MDEGRVDALGIAPVRPWLDEIAALADRRAVERMIGRLHDFGLAVPFALSSAPDNHEPSRVIAELRASGLGLPDRDYYLKPEARFQETREKYRAHVARMFVLAGSRATEAAAASEAVFGLEQRLAEASLNNVALRDPQATDHKTSFAGLQKLAPGFDWPAWFDAAGLPRADLNVTEPKFLAAVDALLSEAPLSTWKAYLQWQVLRASAGSLSRPFVEESFAFYGRELAGAREMKPRWKRCAESTDSLLGEALGRKYVERHFPPEAKAHMQALVRNLLLAMGDTIRGLVVDGQGDQAPGAREALDLQPQGRLPRPLAGLLRA